VIDAPGGEPIEGRSRHAPDTPRGERHDWWGIVLDSADPPTLASFYSAVFGWPVVSSTGSWATLGPPDGVAYLAIQLAEGYVPPTWPTEPSRQQMMMHLDIEVADLDKATDRAVALGARIAQHQPQQTVRVMLDPDGHPFCLYQGE
jgi:predicted enzyme related to lactoylglutathione lyase